MSPGPRHRCGMLWLWLWLWLIPASASAGPGCGETVHEIADGVYVRPGHAAVLFEADNVANLGFVVGHRCVTVIDTGGSVAEGRALDCAIRERTDVPVCFVVNTHVHPDHVLGNAAFRRNNVQFIGHAKLPRAMALRGDTYLSRAAQHSGEAVDRAQIVMPERIVGDTVELDLGGRTVVLQAHPSAHTDNDLSVLDKQTGILFAGDLVFLDHLPVLDGSINGWIDELDRLMREEFRAVVPGHGPPQALWPEAGWPTANYLLHLRKRTRAWIARGGELGGAQEEIEPDRPECWQLAGEYQRRNVSAAFAELEWEN
ncbi:quinoprotein relay system zinc metallohydrolase 2 [soil metagenome]